MREIDFTNWAETGVLPYMDNFWMHVPVTFECLTMENLNLFTIRRNAFMRSCFKFLTDLIIDSQIGVLDDDAFKGLDNLLRLVLKKTKISTFPPQLLKPIRLLNIFAMENCNNVGKISVDNLFGLHEFNHLQEVTINNCNLNKIKSSTFSGARNISKLSLSNDRIEHIADESFDLVLKSLKVLDLSGNKLTSVGGNLFKERVRGVKINLSENPWHCDCNLNGLRKIARSKAFTEMLCATPVEYDGRTLSSLGSLCPIILYPDVRNEINTQAVITSTAQSYFGTQFSFLQHICCLIAFHFCVILFEM